MKPSVIVGLSGGVDSGVTALKLAEAGYNVSGLFMKNWEEDDNTDNCTSKQDFLDATEVAKTIGIPLHTANFATEYWDNVFEHFLAAYQQGYTPNPDILCNREIKFNVFAQYARLLGAELIATGHYARIQEIDSTPALLTGIDSNKDQSYFLHYVQKEHFRGFITPLGELHKQEVRLYAQKKGLPVFNKKDSTGICFIGKRNFPQFISQYIQTKPGIIKTTEGQVIGKHQGIHLHTIGQRQGLGIGGQTNTNNNPWYVVDKCITTNTIFVAQGKNHPALFRQKLNVHEANWLIDKPLFPFRCHAQIRYRQKHQLCTIQHEENGILSVHFDEPQRAVTPAQHIAFYLNERCLGGGVINHPANKMQLKHPPNQTQETKNGSKPT